LGLGLNGHVGFNEPAAFLRPHAHVAELSESSLAHSMLGRREKRPSYGLTLGMADLIQARKVMIMVTGPTKKTPLKRLLCGDITTDFPASLLQLHADALVLCDNAAYEP
jgi:galactosamine-6-phosphate isomerase